MSTSNTHFQKVSFKLAPPTNSITVSYANKEGAVREVLSVYGNTFKRFYTKEVGLANQVGSSKNVDPTWAPNLI